MLSWVVLNFILVIYSNATQLTYSLIWLLVMARMVIWIRSVRPSVQKFSWNFLVFSGTPHGVRDPCGVVYDRARLFEIHVLPQKWEKQTSPRVFEKVQSFFSALYFFINLVYNESLYYCNSCIFEQISYLRKFWFLRYGPKCSWPIRLWDFSINCRTLKLAASDKEINGINYLLVCPSNSFLRNGSIGFSDFWHNGR